MQSGTGKLDDGFSLIFGSDGSIPIGTFLDVSVQWDLTFTDISVHFDHCQMEQGDSTVSIIKDGCYSEALQGTFYNDHVFSDHIFSTQDSGKFFLLI